MKVIFEYLACFFRELFRPLTEEESEFIQHFQP